MLRGSLRKKGVRDSTATTSSPQSRRTKRRKVTRRRTGRCRTTFLVLIEKGEQWGDRGEKAKRNWTSYHGCGSARAPRRRVNQASLMSGKKNFFCRLARLESSFRERKGSAVTKFVARERENKRERGEIAFPISQNVKRRRTVTETGGTGRAVHTKWGRPGVDILFYGDRTSNQGRKGKTAAKGDVTVKAKNRNTTGKCLIFY